MKKHPAEVRSPLVFARCCLVLFMGRNSRTAPQNVRREQGSISKFSGVLFFRFFALFFLFLIVLLLLYLIKSKMGIDIFPNRHVWEVLGL